MEKTEYNRLDWSVQTSGHQTKSRVELTTKSKALNFREKHPVT